MLRPLSGVRSSHKTVSFNATTTAFNYGALDASHNSDRPCTWLALIRPTGAGEGNFGYIASKIQAASADGFRWFVNNNSGSPLISWGVSSPTTGSPSRNSAAGSITYGLWTWVAVTYAGGSSVSAIRIFLGKDRLAETTSYTDFGGSGSVVTNAAQDLIIGNRPGSDRTFNGDIAVIAKWTGVLDLKEINSAIKNGPLSVRNDRMLLCWAGGEDVGPYRLQARSITAKVSGRPYKYPIDVIEKPWIFDAVGSGAQIISPGGIASAELFGALTVLPGGVSVSASGIASLEAFGSHTIAQGGVSVVCSGIASEESFGAHTLLPGAVTVVCNGIASDEAFGAAFVSTGGSLVSPTGISSLEAFGSHTVTPGAVSVICSGIASDEAFGSTVVAVGAQFVLPGSISSLEAFGTHALSVGAVTIVCSGISSLESFGATVVSGGAVLQLQVGVLWALQAENRVYMPSQDRMYRLQ